MRTITKSQQEKIEEFIGFATKFCRMLNDLPKWRYGFFPRCNSVIAIRAAHDIKGTLQEIHCELDKKTHCYIPSIQLSIIKIIGQMSEYANALITNDSRLYLSRLISFMDDFGVKCDFSNLYRESSQMRSKAIFDSVLRKFPKITDESDQEANHQVMTSMEVSAS